MCNFCRVGTGCLGKSESLFLGPGSRINHLFCVFEMRAISFINTTFTFSDFMCVFWDMLCVYMFMCVNMHIWKSEHSLGCWLLHTPPHLFEKKVSYYPLCVPSSLVMSFGGLCLPSRHRSAGVIDAGYAVVFLCGLWDFKLRSFASVTNP